MITGRFVRPTARTKPERPVVWSKWPWLITTTSMSFGERSSRRMFSMSPSGVMPASKRIRRSRSPLRTVTSAEKPCSASSASTVSPPSSVGAGIRGIAPLLASPTRFAGPESSSSASLTLSTSVVTWTESTGWRFICDIVAAAASQFDAGSKPQTESNYATPTSAASGIDAPYASASSPKNACTARVYFRFLR